MPRRFGVSWLATLLLGAGCASSDYVFTAEGALFVPKLTGDARLDGVGSSVGDVSLGGDLDLEDKDYVPAGDVRLSLSGINLWGSGFDTEQSGSSILTAGFGNISAGTPVATDFDLRVYQAGLSFNLMNAGGVRVAPGIGANYFDFNLEVRDQNFGIVENIDAEGPVPLVFLDLDIKVPKIPVTLSARVGGIGGRYRDFEGFAIDGDVKLILTLFDHVDLFGGYRYMTFDVDGTSSGQDFEADLVLQGWMVGGGFRF